MMKYFVPFCAVLLTATALPTDISNKSSNATLRNTGLAGFGAGTTGGQGGAIWTVWDAWALRDAISGNERRIVHVRGRIDLKQLFTGSPGVYLYVGNDKTIIGADANAEIYGGGLSIERVRNVIIQNIEFNNPLSYALGEAPDGNGFIVNQQPGPYSFIDAIVLNNCENVWIDHCEFSDDPWNGPDTPEERRRHDGLIDIHSGASLISISNSIFRNHNMVTLVGNSDNSEAMDLGRLKVTFYLNWYRDTVQRHPLVRFGEVHILNNLYTDIRDYGFAVGVRAQVYLERNVLINVRRAWVLAADSAPNMGLVDDKNILVNSRPDANIPSNVHWRPNQYYAYAPMNAGDVEAHVRRFAGTW